MRSHFKPKQGKYKTALLCRSDVTGISYSLYVAMINFRAIASGKAQKLDKKYRILRTNHMEENINVVKFGL